MFIQHARSIDRGEQLNGQRGIAVENVRENGNDYWIVIRYSVHEEAVPPNIPGFEMIIPLRSVSNTKARMPQLRILKKEAGRSS